ncbi:probable SNW domain-containing protein 1 at N-terminal half [Coccomyxa sp. Obi]|nr:probable SNW domain-containing protein 1 at N-terminal half [Coccomyxa sp. Obi]
MALSRQPEAQELGASRRGEVEATMKDTQAALERLVNGKMTAAQPKTLPAQPGAPTYIKYTPSQQGPQYNSGAGQRIIKMQDMPVHPMEPPKFRHETQRSRSRASLTTTMDGAGGRTVCGGGVGACAGDSVRADCAAGGAAALAAAGRHSGAWPGHGSVVSLTLWPALLPEIGRIAQGEWRFSAASRSASRRLSLSASRSSLRASASSRRVSRFDSRAISSATLRLPAACDPPLLPFCRLLPPPGPPHQTSSAHHQRRGVCGGGAVHKSSTI